MRFPLPRARTVILLDYAIGIALLLLTIIIGIAVFTAIAYPPCSEGNHHVRRSHTP